MNYLLDTCVVSEYLNKRPLETVINWLEQQEEKHLYLSCLTVAELKKGFYKIQSRQSSDGTDSVKAKRIGTWIRRLEERFDGRIVAIDSAVLESWARFNGKSEAKGKNLPVIDSFIAATALHYEMTVVTRNVSDFKRCSEKLKILNPY